MSFALDPGQSISPAFRAPSVLYRTVILVSRAARTVLACATAPAQALSSLALGLLLSRLASSSSTGWGDLLGMVAGILLGPGVALAVLVFFAARTARRTWFSALARTVLALPSPFLAVFLTRFTPLGFPAAACVYLLASTLLVWLASRPVPGAPTPAPGTVS